MRSRNRSSHHRGARAAAARSASVVELAVIVTALAVFVWVLVGAMAGPTVGDLETSPIRVEANQTLWQIATEHPVEGQTTAQTVELIRTVNDMEMSRIYAGQALHVPADSSELVEVAAR